MYTFGRIQVGFVFVAWLILLLEPYFTNQFYFKAPADIDSKDINIFKNLNLAKAVLMVLSWLGSSLFCKVDSPQSKEVEQEVKQ
mmetsp:Transcript_9380/g.14281  ORF Transcript_9380/g.14281 Transcript_9380/m.14281 type:complete len:84 (-) Transcript_9380:33-284(-)